MKIKENKAITLVALSITIIVILILAGITIYTGTDLIGKANLEELRTNMLLVEAKAKEYVEEVDHLVGKDETKRTEARKTVYVDKAGLKTASEAKVTIPSGIPQECYVVQKDSLEKMGLEKIELKQNEYYLILFDETNLNAEIYNVPGYNGIYALTKILEQ